MPKPAGVRVFIEGRHTVTMTMRSDDDDPDQIVLIKVGVDSEPAVDLSGEWRGDEDNRMKEDALAFLKTNGIHLHDA